MSAQHTPGPWRYEQFLPGNAGDFHCIRQGECNYVASTWGGLNESDARLIAAAPDLLEALDKIASFAPGNGDVCELIARTARAAIFKATGSAA